VRKSVGAQVTWGVRFDDEAQLMRFVQQLAGEVSARLRAARVKARSVQVTLLRAVRNAPDSARKGHLGHGICDHLTRSVTLPNFTEDERVLGREAAKMVQDLKVQRLLCTSFKFCSRTATPIESAVPPYNKTNWLAFVVTALPDAIPSLLTATRDFKGTPRPGSRARNPGGKARLRPQQPRGIGLTAQYLACARCAHLRSCQGAAVGQGIGQGVLLMSPA
jgi:hypothetical protein